MAGSNPHRRDYAIEDTPLSARRLAAIWRSLPEQERFGFILALDEAIADQVISLTYEQAAGDTGR